MYRKAALAVEEVQFDAQAGDIAQQLQARYDPRHYRMDVRQAPLLRAFVTYDEAQDRWLMQLLHHHLALDHVGLEVVMEEMAAHLLGRGDTLAPAAPFRNFIAQARLGVSDQEHEAFFRDLLGDVEEPTLRYGLSDVQADGTRIDEARSQWMRPCRGGCGSRHGSLA